MRNLLNQIESVFPAADRRKFLGIYASSVISVCCVSGLLKFALQNSYIAAGFLAVGLAVVVSLAATHIWLSNRNRNRPIALPFLATLLVDHPLPEPAYDVARAV